MESKGTGHGEDSTARVYCREVTVPHLTMDSIPLISTCLQDWRGGLTYVRTYSERWIGVLDTVRGDLEHRYMYGSGMLV